MGNELEKQPRPTPRDLQTPKKCPHAGHPEYFVRPTMTGELCSVCEFKGTDCGGR